MKRFVPVVAALGLVASGLLTSSVAAEPAGPVAEVTGATARATTAGPVCDTFLTAILPSNKLITRELYNRKIEDEKKARWPFQYEIDHLTYSHTVRKTGGRHIWYVTYTRGALNKNIEVQHYDDSAELYTRKVTAYLRSIAPRLVAESGSYYVYGVEGGTLKRWTRFLDQEWGEWYGGPTVVATGMSNLKTLAWSGSFQMGGVMKDVLYATTRTGALKQIQVPWKRPGSERIITVRKQGFASYTGLALSSCNHDSRHLSIIAVDRTHNLARHFTMRGQLTPRGSNLVRRGPVGPGAEWRLHAVL